MGSQVHGSALGSLASYASPFRTGLALGYLDDEIINGDLSLIMS